MDFRALERCRRSVWFVNNFSFVQYIDWSGQFETLKRLQVGGGADPPQLGTPLWLFNSISMVKIRLAAEFPEVRPNLRLILFVSFTFTYKNKFMFNILTVINFLNFSMSI